MCKHKHTTPVLDNLDDGTPVIIHQCDMCGALAWRKDVDLAAVEVATLPPVDMVALERAVTKAWRDVFTMN